MSSAENWRTLFESWPESIPRQGLLVTRFQEQIPFTAFLVSGGILLLERDRPDSAGARKVMIAYEAIDAVKITAPLELSRFQVLGFQTPM
ncbi:MAG: hypothetical protein WD066_02400 [Planctomycetaceae bacterium]